MGPGIDDRKSRETHVHGWNRISGEIVLMGIIETGTSLPYYREGGELARKYLWRHHF